MANSNREDSIMIEELKSKISGLHKTLYGENGRTGLVSDVTKKQDKKCMRDYMRKPSTAWSIIIFAAIFIPLVSTAIRVWTKQEISPHIYAPREAMIENKMKINQIEIQCLNVGTDVQEIKEQIKEQRADVKASLSDIKQMIQSFHDRR